MSIKTRVWIVGRSGRLGSALVSILDSKVYEILGTDITDVDITDLEQAEKYADARRPDIIVNCAAKSDRIWCEENPEDAYALHAVGARNLAIAAERIKAHLFYLSTDFVFDGASDKPYTEFDQPNPQTIYGKTKLAGEMFTKSHCQHHTILRSSWMYGKRLINAIIREAKEEGQVSVYKTIVGSPTSSLELAETIIRFFGRTEYGTYHISCEGESSQREFVREVLSILNIDAELVESDGHGRFEVLRPRYSVLDNFMLRITKQKPMRDWKSALVRFIKERHIGG